MLMFITERVALCLTLSIRIASINANVILNFLRRHNIISRFTINNGTAIWVSFLTIDLNTIRVFLSLHIVSNCFLVKLLQLLLFFFFFSYFSFITFTFFHYTYCNNVTNSRDIRRSSFLNRWSTLKKKKKKDINYSCTYSARLSKLLVTISNSVNLINSIA